MKLKWICFFCGKYYEEEINNKFKYGTRFCKKCKRLNWINRGDEYEDKTNNN